MYIYIILEFLYWVLHIFVTIDNTIIYIHITQYEPIYVNICIDYIWMQLNPD